MGFTAFRCKLQWEASCKKHSINYWFLFLVFPHYSHGLIMHGSWLTVICRFGLAQGGWPNGLFNMFNESNWKWGCCFRGNSFTWPNFRFFFPSGSSKNCFVLSLYGFYCSLHLSMICLTMCYRCFEEVVILLSSLMSLLSFLILLVVQDWKNGRFVILLTVYLRALALMMPLLLGANLEFSCFQHTIFVRCISYSLHCAEIFP